MGYDARAFRKITCELAPELVSLAKEQGREFFEGNPQGPLPRRIRYLPQGNGRYNWDLGEDEEELFELAMHPAQYRNYKSGKAKSDFLADLEKKKGGGSEKSGSGQSSRQQWAAGSI